MKHKPQRSLLHLSLILACSAMWVGPPTLLKGNAPTSSARPSPESEETIAAQGGSCPDIPNKGKAGTWAQDAQVKVNIDPQFRAASPDLTAAIMRAFTNWAVASGWCRDVNESGVTFTFTENPPPPSADVVAGRVSPNTYQVIREIAPNANPAFPAVTGPPPPPLSNPVRSFAYTFVNPGEVAPGHLFEVMVHEIGHTFSLSDCDQCPAGTTVMKLPHGMDGPTPCDNAVIKRVGQYQRQRPLVGDQRTYRVAGTSSRFTTITEKVNELVAGRVVYRVHIVGDPPGLGEYIGCDAMYGEVEVATDVWDEDNPSQNERVIFDPPIFRCPYGSPVDRICEWRGIAIEVVRQVTSVLAYETVTVPFGTFQNVMKVIITEYDNDDELVDEPLLFWIDRRIGIVKAQEAESGGVIELINYRPPVGKTQATGDGTGPSALRLLSHHVFRHQFLKVRQAPRVK